MNEQKEKKIYIALVTIVLGYIIWNSPLTIDDLYYKAFAMKNIKTIFNFALGYGNGRLLGNMLIHFIIQSSIFRVIFQTFFVMLLCYIICKATHVYLNKIFYFGIALYLFVSPLIFREVYLWSSAFANYIPGIICMFAAWHIVKNKDGLVWNFILLLVSVLGQLFVEHTSLINTVLAFVMLIYFIKENSNKQKINKAFIWFIGTAVGMSIMFMIPKLFYVKNEWENYQKSVDITNLKGFIVGILANGMQISGIYLQNVFGLIALSIVLIMLVNPKIIEKIVLISVPMYGLCINFIIDALWTGTICAVINLAAFLVYFICVVMLIIKNHIHGKEKILFYICMCAFSVMPLLVVYPIGTRCLLHSYVFFIMAVLTIINENIEKFNVNVIKLVSVIAMCAFSVIMVVNFHNVRRLNEQRLQYVQKEVDKGNSIIHVPKIESKYVKDNDGWSYGQIFYHNKKQDIKFIFIDEQKWEKEYKDRS